ncbi:MAG TPA: hypothetical protein VFV27_06360 [Nevskiaceae bacterium]|nr:hypothetical protein [Nevskiaceae bacterium]
MALTLLVSGTLVLYSWINTSLRSLSALELREQRLRQRQLAEQWLDSLNPMSAPQGQQRLDEGLVLEWRARPLESPREVQPLPGGTRTPFRVALYQVELWLRDDRGELIERSLRLRIGQERDPLDLGGAAGD